MFARVLRADPWESSGTRPARTPTGTGTNKPANARTRGGATVQVMLSRRQLLAMSAAAALTTLLEAPRAAAQGVTHLGVGMSFFNLDSVPAWIAQDRHFFEKYGLNVTILNFQGGAKAVAAMAAGDVPIALIAASDIINARSRGVPLEMIGGLINRFPYDFVVAKNINECRPAEGRNGGHQRLRRLVRVRRPLRPRQARRRSAGCDPAANRR